MSFGSTAPRRVDFEQRTRRYKAGRHCGHDFQSCKVNEDCKAPSIATVGHLAVWITLIGVTATVILAQGPPNGRRVRWSSDIPLKDAVGPGDTSVAVLKPEHYEPFREEDTAERELLVRAANADYVVIADIMSVTPIVTDQGTWATTEIASCVTRILRYNDDMPRKTPGAWLMVHDGAEIDIDEVAPSKSAPTLSLEKVKST